MSTGRPDAIEPLATSHRCVHLSHSLGSADGGVASAVSELVQAQRRAGLDASWITADRHSLPCRDWTLVRDVRAARPQLLHLHGLWRSPTRIAPALTVPRSGRAALPLVIAPHGMLDPWALQQSRTKKRWAWRLWEQRVLDSARCLQALCQEEAVAMRALGLRAPIAVIPNGVAVPDPSVPLPKPLWSSTVPEGENVLLFFGRFHAKKGLRPLLDAWRRLTAEATRWGWWLVFVGYGDGGALRSEVTRSGLQRCLVTGPGFGPMKESCLAAASAFVLPSFSEGLPMAALEAMGRALPCLLTPACHLSEAFAAGAALAIEPSADDLVRQLEALFKLPEAVRQSMGAAALALARDRFSWSAVAKQTADLYRWIGGGAPCPPFVLL